VTSRRGRGEDSVYLDGDRWRGAASLGYGPDGHRIRKKVSGATKAEVLRKLRDLRGELNAGLPVPDGRFTVAAFLDRWLTKSLPGQVSEKTFDSYADTVRLHIKPSMGRKVLRKLTVSDVDQLLAWKRNAGYSANTVRIIRAVPFQAPWGRHWTRTTCRTGSPGSAGGPASATGTCTSCATQEPH
jgi:hypothetical protein